MGFRASGPLCSTNERQARLQRVYGGRGRTSCASAGVWGGQGPSIMRISACLGRAGAKHHAHQRVSGEGRGRASCASAGVWEGQGPSIMRISGCLGRAAAEHHAHQRVSGEGRGRASCASAGVWGASNPVQSKSNEIKFRWTCEKQIHGGKTGTREKKRALLFLPVVSIGLGGI